MTTGRREWDIDLVNDLFNDRDQRLVLNVQLWDNIVDDTIYWSMENSGLYSVRSSYRLLQSHKGLWNVVDNSNRWWKLQQKCWILCGEQLRAVYQRCHCSNKSMSPVQDICPMCSLEEETIMHALVSCFRAIQIWRSIIPDVIQEVGDGFCRWLHGIIHSTSHDKRALVVIVC